MAQQSTTAARRYAEAAFQLATRDKAVDAYADGLEVAARLLGDEQVMPILRNPARPLQQRTDLVDMALGKHVPEQVRKLVVLLVQRGRIDQLVSVVAEFRRLRNHAGSIVEALATSAAPLSADETEALQKKVAQMTGQTVDLRVEVDESLIGGLTVRVGDTLYDASVRGRLERLRERLVAGAL